MKKFVMIGFAVFKLSVFDSHSPAQPRMLFCTFFYPIPTPGDVTAGWYSQNKSHERSSYIGAHDTLQKPVPETGTIKPVTVSFTE